MSDVVVSYAYISPERVSVTPPAPPPKVGLNTAALYSVTVRTPVLAPFQGPIVSAVVMPGRVVISAEPEVPTESWSGSYGPIVLHGGES